MRVKPRDVVLLNVAVWAFLAGLALADLFDILTQL